LRGVDAEINNFWKGYWQTDLFVIEYKSNSAQGSTLHYFPLYLRYSCEIR
jgi:hypothetical protein